MKTAGQMRIVFYSACRTVIDLFYLSFSLLISANFLAVITIGYTKLWVFLFHWVWLYLQSCSTWFILSFRRSFPSFHFFVLSFLSVHLFFTSNEVGSPPHLINDRVLLSFVVLFETAAFKEKLSSFELFVNSFLRLPWDSGSSSRKETMKNGSQGLKGEVCSEWIAARNKCEPGASQARN